MDLSQNNLGEFVCVVLKLDKLDGLPYLLLDLASSHSVLLLQVQVALQPLKNLGFDL